MKHILITLLAGFLSMTAALARTDKEFYEQFAQQIQSRDSVAAAATISEWEKVSPSSVELLIARVNYCYLKSMGKEAVVTTTEPPKGNTQFFMLRDTLGNVAGYMYSEVQYDEDMFAKCMDTFRQGIEAHPDRVDLRQGQAAIYFERGMYDKACRVLLSMIARSKVNGCRWNVLFEAPLEKSQYYDSLQDYFAQLVDGECDEETVGKYVDALTEAYPDYSIFRADKAYVYLMRQDIPSALAEYKAVLEMDPSDMIVVLNIAYLYETMGDVESAKLYYGKVASNSDADPRSREGAQMALKRLGAAE